MGFLHLTLADLLRILGQVLEGAAVFVAVWLVARLVRRVVRRALARRQLRADMALVTERALYIVLIALGLFVALSLALGQSGAALTGVLVTAFVTGVGLQDLLKNYVAGFFVLMERNFGPGTVIHSEAFSGRVMEIRLRTTFLRADNGDLIVVPNNDLFNKTVAVAHEAPGSVEGAEDHSGEARQVLPGQL